MTGSEQCSDGPAKHRKISFTTLLRPPYDPVRRRLNRAVWTDNGRIYAKYSKDINQSHSLQIKTASDIDTFIREINHLLPGPAAAVVAGTT